VVAITRERFWQLLDHTHTDWRETLVAMPKSELLGYVIWHGHYTNTLACRSSIGSVAYLCLDGWPAHERVPHPVDTFASWLVALGEDVVEAAVRDPDTIAAHIVTNEPPVSDWLSIVAEVAASRGIVLEYEASMIPEPFDWPLDPPENLAEPSVARRIVPQLVQRLELEFLRTTMPRAPWQREAEQRDRWWTLAWDLLEANTIACEPIRFWRLVENITWPRRESAPLGNAYRIEGALRASGARRNRSAHDWAALRHAPALCVLDSMLERIAFALRFHAYLAKLDSDLAAWESANNSRLGGDRTERIAGVIASGRASYEAALATPALVAKSTAKLGFAAFVDNLRRSRSDELLSLLPRGRELHLSSKATTLAVGDLVIDEHRGHGFIEATQPGAPPDRIVYFGHVAPLAPTVTPRATYSPKATFAIGDLLAHPTFGDGEVIAKPSPGKITVRFADGSKRVLATSA
jgi:hypothetical protein